MREKNVDLISCPFCGSKELLQTDKMVTEQIETAEGPQDRAGAETMEPPEWFVVCGMCSAMGPLSPSPREAHAAWNNRFDGGIA